MTQKGIPEYNSLSDRYCPRTHTQKFAGHYKHVLENEKVERRRRLSENNKRQRLVAQHRIQLQRSQGHQPYVADMVLGKDYGDGGAADGMDPMSRSAPARMGGGGGGGRQQPPGAPHSPPYAGSPLAVDQADLEFGDRGPGPQQNVARPHGGVTFQRAQSTDPATELEVLKTILLREGYLKRLQHAARRRGGQTALRADVIDLLDLIRTATVEVVESIAKWRRTLVKPYPFVWNGINYLLKIPSDMDILAKVPEVSEWLGFQLARNPFVVPISLDQRPKTADVVGALQSNLSTRSGRSGGRSGNSSGGSGQSWHEIGSSEPMDFIRAQQLARTDQTSQERAEKRSKLGGAMKGIVGQSYNTAVVNDPELTGAQSSSAAAAEAAETQKKQMVAQEQASGRPFPTSVGDVDMMRIRDCEKVLLEEEIIHGRMMRDEYGRLVPEALRIAQDARKIADADYTHPGDETAMAAQGASKRRRGKDGEALAGSSSLILDETGVDLSRDSAHSEHMHTLEDGMPKGKKRALRDGGQLTPLGRKGTRGRTNKPRTGRARAARLDVEIKRGHAESVRLSDELETAKKELAEVEAQVVRLEREEMADGAATTIQSQARARRARLEVERKRLEVIQQQQEVERREKELEQHGEEMRGKEASRNDYREKRLAEQQDRREALLERKMSERKGKDPERGPSGGVMVPEKPEAVEDVASVSIQRIARGRLGKNYVKRRRRRYRESSTRIQACVRGRRDRLEVRRRVVERDAAVHVQRTIRGMLGRRKASRVRRARTQRLAATDMQRIFRALKGRRRMQAKRDLRRYAAEAKQSIETLFASDISDLSYVDEPKPVVNALMTCIRMLWPAGQGPPQPAGADCYRWPRIRRRMRRPHFLPRLRNLADAAMAEVLQIPTRRVRAVKVFYNDPDFHTDSFRLIGQGTKAATALHIFLRALIEAEERIKIFLPGAPTAGAAWREAELERLDSESSGDDVLEREFVQRYVPHEVLRCSIVRPRPVLLVVSRDVPQVARVKMLESLSMFLPGGFARIDRGHMDASLMQGALDMGQSLVLDADVGIGASTRNAFLASFETVKKTLQPTPLCLLVAGVPTNRSGGGSDPLLGVRGNLVNMADAPLKVKLEASAEALFPLRSPSGATALREMADVESPDYGLVLVMETLLVLTNPGQTFKGPAATVGAVSWEAARVLLRDPARLLLTLDRVDVENIPMTNLRALVKYVEHPGWPDLGKLPTKSPKKRSAVRAEGEKSNESDLRRAMIQDGSLAPPDQLEEDEEDEVPALVRLTEWANAVVGYARLLSEEGGPAATLSRKNSEFESVTLVRDDAPAAYGGAYQGWREALSSLLGPILRDVKVYGEARRINNGKGNNTVVNVYRDRQRLYFGCYDPKESVQRWTYLEDSAVNRLLAPNSMERSAPKPRPESSVELYKRLVGMLHLERPRGSVLDRRDGPPVDLVIRRDLVPLFKESRKIDSIFAVINAAEEAPGEIRINAYVPERSHTFSLLIDEDTIARLAAESSGVEREALESGAGNKVVGPIVDRLKFHWKRGGTKQSSLEMGLRMKGIGGRKIMSRGLRINGMHHVVTLYERAGELRVEVYQPLLSRRTVLRFSLRERLELLGSTNWGQKDVWITEVCRRLSLKGPVKEPRKQSLKFDRTLHSQASRVGKTYVTLTFSLPEPDLGLLSEEERRSTAAAGSSAAGTDQNKNTEQKPATESGLHLRAYNNRTSSEYLLRMTDDQVRTLLEFDRLMKAGVFARHMSKDEKEAKMIEEKRRIARGGSQKTGGGPALQWPCRTKKERVEILQTLVKQLHWAEDQEPRLSKDPTMAIGEKHAPVVVATRVSAGSTGIPSSGGGGGGGGVSAKTGRMITSRLADETQVDFSEAGPLVFEGEQSIGLRKMKIEMREVQNSRRKRHSLRLLGTDKGGTEYTGEFLEEELVEKLGLLPKSKTPTDAAVPKLLQRLKCKQGAFFLESRTKSRGSTGASTRPGTTATVPGTANESRGDGGGEGTRTPGTAGSTFSSSEGGGESDELSFGKKFLQAETVELGSNGSSGGLFDVEEMDPEGQRGEDYEMIYRKGFKIMPEEQRTITVEGTVTEEISVKNPPDRMFYVVEVYVSDPDRRDEWSGGDHDGDQNGEEKETTDGGKGRFEDFGLEDKTDRRKIRFSLYNPLTSYRVGITLGRKELEEVVAKHADLMDRGREADLIEYVLYERLRLMPPMQGPPGVDTVQGKGDIIHERLTTELHAPEGTPSPPFRLELLRARVFGTNKITPLPLSGVRDAMANRGSSVLIREDPLGDAIAPYAGRGNKLFNLAHRMPVAPTPDAPKGGMSFVMCTAFDMSTPEQEETRADDLNVETTTLGVVRLPRLRILAYDPATSHRMQILIGGSDLLESISSSGAIDEELLVGFRRILLAKHLIKCLRIQRRRTGLPVLKLLSLTETLADERRREQEEDAAQRLKDVSERKKSSQDARVKKRELEEQRERERSIVDGETGAVVGVKEENEDDAEDLRENWEIAADYVNRRWKEGVDVDGHSIVVTASAVNVATLKGAMGDRNELWSSESELDFSDDGEVDMSRSELRLMITVYSPELAETASATVPTIVISQLLGAPLEHLEKLKLAKGLAKIMEYADLRVRGDAEEEALVVAEHGEEKKERDVDAIRQGQEREKMRGMLEQERQTRTASTDSSEFGMPQELEPRMTFSIDPQLAPRVKKEMESTAGEIKKSSSPGMPSVSTVGEQIFHRAMRIDVSFYICFFLCSVCWRVFFLQLTIYFVFFFFFFSLSLSLSLFNKTGRHRH